MDPNACADRILAAWAAEDWEEVEAACFDLHGWLGRGGFPPDGLRTDRLLKLGASERCMGEMPAGIPEALDCIAGAAQEAQAWAADEVCEACGAVYYHGDVHRCVNS